MIIIIFELAYFLDLAFKRQRTVLPELIFSCPTPVQRIINHTTAARAFVSSPLLLSCGLAVAPEAAPGLLAVDVHDRCS